MTPPADEHPDPGQRPMPVRVYRLGEEPVDDLLATTPVQERLRLLRELTEPAWALTGRPLPSYRRHGIPVRVVDRG